jgi:hypothetical protein
MASSYTSNTGIEKPGSGEQAGTWGTTTNTNFDIIDQALHGQVSLTITGNTDLTTSDGATSDGANTVIILTGTPGSTFELRVTPTDQEKFYTIKNETDAACRVIYKDVTYSTSNGVEIAANSTKAVTGDGQGSSGVFKSLTPITELVDDTTPQLGGVLATNGNNIEFPDSSGAEVNRLKFGAGDDLQLYHDTNNSYIEDSGTGVLVIKGSQININSSGNESMAAFVTDGAAILYHDNAEKITTTSAGVDVTGTVQGDSFTLDNGSNDWTVTVSSNKLRFNYAGTAKMELDTSGNLKVTGDVTAFGTIS